ncbi:carotenoid 9,10(9',10')-cleavage dioxygenase 1-like isoform X1 [Nicotiana sylvestris]|uniref:Carotenoid 9,10(9',10')-cleavage dioxygenase 1-like isoform X1 n=1 Tax=Nicotiana sylvestris TaxID=4096 RepID=A0A1U7Z003_NICSY|nr:PREDICTED: carotenoid 9,10(9',10')-cleavage dioxygenase 1-like isoform X1 [Nicotiana sylvestris]
MAAYSYALQVNKCSLQRPSLPHKIEHFSNPLSTSFKPLLRDLDQFPNISVDVTKAIKETSCKLLDAFVDFIFEFADQPLLPSQRNFAPVEEIGESTLSVTRVEGTIPDDFPEGVYIRNGPNPLFGGLKSTRSIFGESDHMWVEGEGMLHALYLKKNGRIRGSWNILYKNKHVQTDTYKMEKDRKKPGFLPAIEGDSPAVLLAYLLNVLRFGVIDKYLSNTNVFEHAKKYYSIAENHMPQEIDIHSLETLENWNVISGSWTRPFTSHPKKAPGTGELVVIGIDAQKPYFELGVISADGKKMVHKADLMFDRCTVCHEIGVTQRYNVIMNFPLTIDISRLVLGGSLMRFEENGYARIGIMPRYGDANSIKWFEVEPCCVFHIINCFEDNDEVVVRACRARQSVIPGPNSRVNHFEKWLKGRSSKDERIEFTKESTFPRVCEWRLNMKTGEVREKKNLSGDEFAMEFPLINEKFTGFRNKFAYLQVVESTEISGSGFTRFGGVAKLHFEEKRIPTEEEDELIKAEYHMLPQNTFCSGASFVPKPGGVDEDDGSIITFTHNENENISQVYIVDAKKFTNEPVAIITLPSRVPYGFHGAFMPLES